MDKDILVLNGVTEWVTEIGGLLVTTKFGFLDTSKCDRCSELHAEFLDVDNP